MKKFFILFCLLPLSVFAQKVENDPYSRYGLGDFADQEISAYRSMGHLSIANIDRFHINLANPASVSLLGTSAYEVGANAKNSTFSEGSNQAKNWSGNLDYIALGFPLRNPINEAYETARKKYKLGMAFGLNRYTRSAYNISSTDSLPDVGVFDRSYTGSGGTYKFHWSNGISYKNLAFGIDLSYLFGNINASKDIIFRDLDNAFNNFYTRSYHLSSFGIKTGLIYHLQLNAKQAHDNPSIPLRTLRFGLTLSPGFGFSTQKDEIIITRQLIGTTSIVTDTFSNKVDFNGKGKLPFELGGGVMYQAGDKSCIGLEYKYAGWSSYYNEATGEVEGSLGNAWQFAMGGYYRPNYKSYTSFWKRAFYKYGAYYRQDPRLIIGEQLSQYGVTFGAGLPFVFQRKIAHADIGLDIGRKGSGTIIEENYIKINFGFTFNDDEWFIKRKYN